ncbi:MAG: efflux RND transporter periplasmic adaptor subunit [Gemmatimonadaceae bacterium]
MTSSGSPSPAATSHAGRNVVVLIVLVAGVLLLTGILPRITRGKRVEAEAREVAGPPIVTVASAKLGSPTNTISLPATLYGLHETGIYTRTNGYVRSLRVDMGSHVRTGDTLVIIEMPELDQEYNQAKATYTQVQATNALTKSTLDRWTSMVKQGAATQQELDEKLGAFNVAQAASASARANIDRLAELKRFGTITAPFGGIVTARGTDVGALVSPTTGTGAKPLFSLVQVDTLRVVANVPQSAAPNVKVGQPADVFVQELGSTAFHGKVTRTAQALDLSTRTLMTEILVDNREGRLMPGMFGHVDFELTRGTRSLLVPANTLMIRASGPQVAVVRDGKIHIVAVTLGRDFGSEVEVRSGVNVGEQLVVNPGDEIADGLSVRLAPPVAKKP